MPQNAELLLEAYRKQGDHKRAIQMFRRATVKYKGEVWPLRALAGAYRAQRDHDEARHVTEEYPKDVLSWMQLQEYEIKGDYGSEIQLLKDAIQKNPAVAPLWTHLGMRYEARGDFTSAIDAFEQAFKVEPAAFRLSHLRIAFQAKGDHDTAIETRSKHPGRGTISVKTTKGLCVFSLTRSRGTEQQQ